MTPEQLEKCIEKRGMDVLRWNAVADSIKRSSAYPPGSDSYARSRARIAARDVARLVAQRTPETVARMEKERGLA